MLKLFRKGLKSPVLSSLRAGHGWEAPPPPLNTTYENKRLISIFDGGMWWACGTAPEYLVSYFEMHLHDQYGALHEIARVGSHSLLFSMCFFAFVLLSNNSNEFGLVEESVEENVKNSLQQIRNRPANKRNVFGFSTSNEDGRVILNYDKAGTIEPMLKAHIKELDGVRQVNLEAKNCILKLEEICRKKYQ